MQKSKKKIRKPIKKRKTNNRHQQVRIQKLILLSLCLLLILLAAFIITRRHITTTAHINSTCESYRENVAEQAANYDMSDYVDLILALMMQESSGQGTDVLQSSEGSFNTQYPQTPNSITDVDYSISCGIQELKYSMQKAGVKNAKDIEHIKLALQGYNFGADSYFNFLEQNGITSWSAETSEEFAKMASNETERSEDDPLYSTAGHWNYGDQYYPEHVLRYYSVS